MYGSSQERIGEWRGDGSDERTGSLVSVREYEGQRGERLTGNHRTRRPSIARVLGGPGDGSRKCKFFVELFLLF